MTVTRGGTKPIDEQVLAQMTQEALDEAGVSVSWATGLTRAAACKMARVARNFTTAGLYSLSNWRSVESPVLEERYQKVLDEYVPRD